MKSMVRSWIFRTIVVIGLFSIASCGQVENSPTPIPTTQPAATPLTLTSTPTPTLESTFTPSPTESPSLPPVVIDHQDLTVNGKPFRFVGANTIYFGFYEQYGYSIEEAIQSAKENGINVIRIYLGFGINTWGDRPIEEYDKTLDIAAQNGMYVIAVLTDCCCFGGEWSQTEASYYDYVPYCKFTDPAALISLKSYLDDILLRKNSVNGKIYRDDTTILAWDVANEPYLHNISDSDLHTWLQQVTQYIKTIDPNHLLTFGLDTSDGKYDADGPHYDALNVSDLDFFSIHNNLPDYATASQHYDLLNFRMEKFLSMGKPVILEEFGVGTLRMWGALESSSMDQWVQAYKDQMDITFSAGGSGAMFWGWGVPETSTVPLWWKYGDHDVTEAAFCEMLQGYQIPSRGSFVMPELPYITPNDSFESENIDRSRWQASLSDYGSITQEGGRISLFVDNMTVSSFATLRSTWLIKDDFDIQIDFEIGEGWMTPATDHLDGAVFGVNIAGRGYHITRLRTPTDDLIFGWDDYGNVLGSTPATAVIGKYKLVRTGTTLTMFFDIGDGWQEFVKVEVDRSPAQVYFMNGSVNASLAFTTYFDNFLINSGQTNYQP